MIKMIDSAKTAFEQLQLRLNTMTELGDVVVALNPAMNAIKGIQGGLSSMMPQADQSFGQISDLLGNIMTGSSQTSTTTAAALDSSSIKLDEEAIDILQEATSSVEENTRDKLPDLPLSKDRVLSDTKAASSLDV
jgi:division protein CdvB (Snf7/Vps24/ESCRT-III family)